MISLIKFYFKLITQKRNFPSVKYFVDDEDGTEDPVIYGYINIQYMGVVNEPKLHMAAHKYVLSFQRNPKAKLIARNLYNFDQGRYKEDMKLALKKMREDIRSYYI